MTWKRRIGSCFGSVDKKFALHSADEKRAFRLLEEMREEGVSWNDARDAAKDYLKQRTSNAKHISDQMKRVREYWKPWLS